MAELPDWVLGLLVGILVLAWIVFSIITVFAFAVRRKDPGNLAWFIVAFLLLMLIIGILIRGPNGDVTYVGAGLALTLAAGIAAGIARGGAKQADLAPPRFVSSEPFERSRVGEAGSPAGPTPTGETSFDGKYCFECGAVIRAKAEICPKCGVRQLAVGYNAQAAPGGRSKLAAALFALILGGLGIHKFYLGQIPQGIVYLLFCWTFIPAIIGFIEGIVLLSMSERAFAAKFDGVRS